MGEDQGTLILKELLNVTTQIARLDKAVNNGLVQKIEKTNTLVTKLSTEFEEYKNTGHLLACPYLQEKELNKEKKRNVYKFTTASITFLSLVGATLVTWLGIFRR